jgi:adenosylhomocysteine nucleosidase
MEGEMSFLRRAMTPPDKSRDIFVVGKIGRKTVMLVKSGVGPASATKRLAETKYPQTPQCVLSIGCAGALSPELAVGDTVIAQKIVDDADDDESFAPEPELTAIAAACCEQLGFPFHSGTTVSAPEVAATVEAKQRLAAKHGAIAVDMETAQVAAWARKMGAPTLALRTISDTASDCIPPELGGLVDSKTGKLRPARAAAVFSRKPKLLAEAMRLKRNMDHSLEILAQIAPALLSRL